MIVIKAIFYFSYKTSVEYFISEKVLTHSNRKLEGVYYVVHESANVMIKFRRCPIHFEVLIAPHKDDSWFRLKRRQFNCCDCCLSHRC